MTGRYVRCGNWLVFLGLFLSAHCFSQGLEYVKANYTKYEHYIPMRDGVRLFTAVYIPKDHSNSYPILLIRTPYSVGPYGEDAYRENIGPSPLIAKEGYIIVFQAVRGRWMSEGQFEHMRPHRPVKTGPKEIDESTDTYDTIDWLLKNVPGHNGRVGLWGISYPGFYAAAGMIDAHPALKAVSPQAPVSDWFASDDWHHNGALLLAHAFGWFSGAGWSFSKPSTVAPDKSIDRGTEDGYEFFLRLGPMRNANEKFLKNEIPFWNEMMKRESRDEWWKARNIRAHLSKIKPAVMTVGGWFDAENLFGALEVYRSVESQSPGAFNILVMGPWIHGGWESAKGDSLGDVRFDAPTAEFYREHIELPFFNYFLKDKGKQELPEAYVFETGTNRWRKFDSWPPKTVIPKPVYLHDKGSLSFDPPGSDTKTDFDEYTSDPKKPEPFVSGEPTRVEFNISDLFHTFRRGHRIMIQIQSTWFPLINVNPQKFLNINEASEADFQAATQRVYHSRTRPSLVKVFILSRALSQ